MEALPPPDQLVAEVARLRRDVRQLKAALKATRDHLQVAASRLARVEAACRTRGIEIRTVSVPRPQPAQA